MVPNPRVKSYIQWKVSPILVSHPLSSHLLHWDNHCSQVHYLRFVMNREANRSVELPYCPFHPQRCILHLLCTLPFLNTIWDISDTSIHMQFHYFSYCMNVIIYFISSTVMAFDCFQFAITVSSAGIIVFICTSIMNICRINSQKWNCKIKGDMHL